MTLPENLTVLNRDELLVLVVEQQRQIAELMAVVEALRAEIARLTRDAKRQTAPFSKGTRVTTPKRLGRKPGSGRFCYRAVPPPDQIPEPPVDVPVARTVCPPCGGPLEEERIDFADTPELPALPRPQVTQYRVAVCRWTVCGTQVRGHHPDVAPDPYGATAHRLGDRVMAAAHTLHDGVGLPVRKVPIVMAALTGLIVTQGASTQDALRRAVDVVGNSYEALRAAVPEAPVVHTDDTGWRVGGEPASLMAFETNGATVYQVRPQQRHEEVQEVIPPDDEGVMVTDRGRSYDAQAVDNGKQQKCLAHILRSISDVWKTQQGRARDFGERLQTLLTDAIQGWHASHAGKTSDFEPTVQRLHDVLTSHLRNRCLTDPDNQRLLKQIGRHHDRGTLLRFLEDLQVEPTNNRAERALRPAVMARKVSQCSKNTPGAQAFAAFTSVVRTLAKRGVHSTVQGLYELFRAAHVQGAPS